MKLEWKSFLLPGDKEQSELADVCLSKHAVVQFRVSPPASPFVSKDVDMCFCLVRLSQEKKASHSWWSTLIYHKSLHSMEDTKKILEEYADVLIPVIKASRIPSVCPPRDFRKSILEFGRYMLPLAPLEGLLGGDDWRWTS